MNTKLALAVLGIGGLLSTNAGCVPGNHHVMSRNLVSTTSGGPNEVWLVMSEVATEHKKKKVGLNHAVYIVYHCIPKGCKRVGEISGLEVYERQGTP